MITEVKHIAITPMYPEEDFLRKVENFFEGVKKALIIRLDEAFYTQDLVEEIENLSKKSNSIVIYNSRNDISSKKNIHLTSTDLMNYKDKREYNFLLGASCHNQNEIEKANQLKCDYILISPILKDKSGNKKIGWEKFEELAKHFNGISFALGGVKKKDLNASISHGGAGISGISCFF